ncbi:MAG: methylenetetrahydrofolate reductase, partial [Lachnospiraceae bacterium]
EDSRKAAETPKRKGFLYDQDGNIRNKKFIAVELAPPFDANDEKLLESAHALVGAGVDVLTFPDSPSGRTRVDSVLMADKVYRETGIEVMPHICCRDKNAVAMRSLFMGARINDIHNLLIITGDPLPSMVRATVKSVFNFDSVGLMKIAREMNEETFYDSPLCYGGAINQGRKNLEVEIGRVKKKLEAGAEFFLTQPVFCKEDVDRLRRIKEETGARILCGIMPLISRKNALFMKNEISGVNVPDELIEKYPVNGSRQEGEQVGIELAKSMIAITEDFVDGWYFSFPFNRTYLLKNILNLF